MAMTINNRMVAPGDRRFYNAEWFRVVESHLQWIRTLPGNQEVVVEDAIAYKYEGDFMGLLQELRIPMEIHWVVLRLNGYTSPSDFSYERTKILIPDQGAIGKLFNVHNTVSKKIS